MKIIQGVFQGAFKRINLGLQMALDSIRSRQGSCLTAGIVRYFGSTANFTSAVQSDADIVAKVNAESFPDGGDAFPSDSMGGPSSEQVTVLSGKFLSRMKVKVGNPLSLQ